MLANPWVRLTNNWLHDVGTGLWAACLLVIWLLNAQIEKLGALTQASAAAINALVEVNQVMFWVLVAALVDITITGAIRLVYWRSQTPAEEMGAKRPALIGKHIAFLVIYGGGTWWAYTMVAAS